jgi:hypothetical protein
MPSGRKYTVSFDNVAVTVASDFFELNPAADKPIYITGLVIGQTNRTGDANEDLLRWSIVRMTGGTLTSGTGGTAPTPATVAIGEAAAGFTAEVNNTTQASTTGTTTTLHADVFNTRVGLQYFPLPDDQPSGIDSAGTGILVVRLLEAPGASTTMSGTVYVEEMG